MTDLSVIIVNWNTCNLLDNCLNSIFSDNIKHTFELIVVDNASIDNSVEMIKSKYPQVRLIVNKENLGFSKANNQGFKISIGKYIMFLNSDTIVKPGAIDKIIEYMDNHPEVGVLGPKLLNADGTLQISAAKLPNLLNSIGDLIFGFFRDPFLRKFTSLYSSYDKSMQVGWVSGACLVARREVVKKIDGWEEKLFMYSEDVVFGVKVNQLGYKVIFYPEAEIFHLRNQSSKSNPEWRILQVYRSRAEFRKIYFRKGSYMCYLIFTNIVLIPRILFYFSKYLVRREKDFSIKRAKVYCKVISLYTHYFRQGLL